MIKPCDFDSKLEEIKNDYKETYEMYVYLDGSRDGYIEENIKLKEDINSFKRLSFYLFICFVIEFILFLVSINL